MNNFHSPQHDDDEFAEAVALAQFVDGAQGDVGFACAGFHFDGEGGMSPRFIADAFDDHAIIHFEHACQAGGDLTILLDLAQVVVEPGFVERLEERQVGDDLVAEREFGGLARQAFEEARDAFDGGFLKRLFRIKLNFEGHGLDNLQIALVCQLDLGFIA